MDWEASGSSYKRAIGEELSSFDFGAIFTENPEVTMAEMLSDEPQFSNFEIGESSGTSHEKEESQVIGVLLRE